MATTSARALALLSVLSSGATVGAADLAARAGVGERTVRRDVETLRGLGYDVRSLRGAGGGYRLHGRSALPPLVFDEDQVVAIAVALQTAPTVLAGIAESNGRALATVRQVMPERLRIEADAYTVTSVPNYWEFPAPPIDARLVREVGAAVRRRHILRADYAEGEGEPLRLRLEPHHLVVWAARWYLIAFDLDGGPSGGSWRVLRLDRLTAKAPTHVPFGERPLPAASPEALVKRTYDRGDAVAAWPCRGSAVLDVAPEVAAEFAPGGALVEAVTSTTCRLSMGAWSWIGLAGLFVTFGTDMHEVEPADLRGAFAELRTRLGRIPSESAG